MDIRHYKEWIQIGLNILHYRKERRWTQEQLADACGEDGMSRNFIQRIETGVSSCSIDTLIDIAKALDIPLYKLFEFKD
ncbi:MAG: helix-turn-helix transcriptional regulator [Oscillibacter sp.]|nr:helix-turn-helix transcriptional regulator [Oscillibacter sp.]